MYFAIWPSPSTWVATLATAFVVKAMDDAIDRPRDDALGLFNWANQLGPSLTVYTIVIEAVAMVSNRNVAISFLAGSYVVGMLSNMRDRMPSGLRGWQEAVLVGGLTLWWLQSRWHLVLGAAAIMFVIQLMDDALDRTTTILWANTVWVRVYLIIVSTIAAGYLAPSLAVTGLLVWLGYTAIELAFRYNAGRRHIGDAHD